MVTASKNEKNAVRECCTPSSEEKDIRRADTGHCALTATGGHIIMAAFVRMSCTDLKNIHKSDMGVFGSSFPVQEVIGDVRGKFLDLVVDLVGKVYSRHGRTSWW